MIVTSFAFRKRNPDWAKGPGFRAIQAIRRALDICVYIYIYASIHFVLFVLLFWCCRFKTCVGQYCYGVMLLRALLEHNFLEQA